MSIVEEISEFLEDLKKSEPKVKHQKKWQKLSREVLDFLQQDETTLKDVKVLNKILKDINEIFNT